MLSLDLVKSHCRIDSNDEDEVLQSYIEAALGHIESQLGRKLYDDNVPDSDLTGIVINAPIRHAALMLIAHWYENRESVVVGNFGSKEIEIGTWRLIQPYRIMGA